MRSGYVCMVASAKACSRRCVSPVARAPANSTRWCLVPRNLWKNRTDSRPRQSMSRASAAAISRAWSGAEIMPPKKTGVRPARSWQQAVVLRDNGTMAVADVQFCHGSAHPLLHHFFARQNRSQLLLKGLRERKMRLLAEHGPVQMVCQIKHVLPDLVTLRMVTIEKACWGSGV